jgi:MFS family permease
MTTDAPDFHFRSIALPALLPSLLFAIGEGAIIPIIPAVASNLGAGLAMAGFIAAMIMVGNLVGDIPSGVIVSRVGEKNAMIGAAVVSVIGVLLCIVTTDPWVLGGGIFLLGVSAATFALARHAFMTTFVPLAFRARALSTLGGTFRAGWFVGPFIAAGLIALTGSVQIVFWVQIIMAAAVIVILIFMKDPRADWVLDAAETPKPAEGQTEPATEPAAITAGAKFVNDEAVGLFRTIWAFRGVLVRIGSGVAVVSALRASRTVILPLWAVSIGVNEIDTALIIGIGGGMDFALFYASGQIMDRFGRLFSVIPSMLGLGAGLLVLSVTHDLPSAVIWFIAMTVFTGIANGLGSGILMTLGADLAPQGNPAPFLGAFRFTGDFGTAAAPLALAAIVAVASLPLATAIIGALGFVGAGILIRYVPRYVPKRPGRRSA